MLFRKRTNSPGIQRIEVIDRRRISTQRQPHRHRIAERMKERQDTQQHVTRMQTQQLVHSIQIRGDVVLRQHHALRLTRGTGSKDHRQRIVRTQPVQTQQPAQHSQRHQLPLDRRSDPVKCGDLSLQVLEKNQLGVQLHRLLLNERPAGQHLPNTGLANTVIHQVITERIVQVDRHLPAQRQRCVRQHTTHRRRQQHAHIVPVRRQDPAGQQTPKSQCPHQQATTCQNRAAGIADLHPAPRKTTLTNKSKRRNHAAFLSQ